MATLRLLTHNAYWFQGSPSLWGQELTRPHEQVLQALTEFYRDLAPDVLCLQEVPTADVVDRLCASLVMVGQHVPGGERSEYGGALLWRASGASVRDLSRCPVGEDRVFERICLELRVLADDRTVTVVNAHLASNRYAPDRQGEPVRLAELETVLAASPEAAVVAGDFNAGVDSRVHERMATAGYDDVCGDVTLDPEHVGRRIDYVWVRRDARIVAIGCHILTGADLALPGHPGVALSDHPALCVDLEINR